MIKLRHKVLGLVLAGGLAAAPVQAQQDVNFQGYTNGCFGLGCLVPNTSAYQNATLASHLIFQNAMFNVTTGAVTGYASMGTPAVSGVGQNYNNLGSLFYDPTYTNVYNSPFTLAVRFTIPTITNQLFSATLFGEINAPLTGGVGLHFSSPATQTFAFIDPHGRVGQATLHVNDVDLNPSAPNLSITGNIQASVAPEPMSIVLLATGLMALLGVALIRRRGTEEMMGDNFSGMA